MSLPHKYHAVYIMIHVTNDVRPNLICPPPGLRYMKAYRHILSIRTSKGNGKKSMCDPQGCNQSDQMLLKVNSLSSENCFCNLTSKNYSLFGAAPWEGFGASGEGVDMVDAEVENSWDLGWKDWDAVDVWDEDEKASMSKFRLLTRKSVVLETLWCRFIIASRWSASRFSKYARGAARARREKVTNHRWPPGKELMRIILGEGEDCQGHFINGSEGSSVLIDSTSMVVCQNIVY